MRKEAYLVGIKGVAMTALALYLKEAGYLVSGSDVEDEFLTDAILKKRGIMIKKGFSKKNISKDYSLVVTTGAHGGMTNVEVKEAIRRKIPALTHGQMLGMLSKRQRTIAVSGSHGKTTTTSIISSLLINSGLDPSYLVGAPHIVDIGVSGHYGRGKYMVVEADEYMTCPKTDKTPRFLWLKPEMAVVTNIDFDHPDRYENIDQVKNAFKKFVRKIRKNGILVLNADDNNTYSMIDDFQKLPIQVITYGYSPKADYTITKSSFSSGLSFMNVEHKGIDLGEFVLKIPGRHNLKNAVAAMIVANLAGISWVKIRKLLKKFKGTSRRFEKIAKLGSIYLYDDYAHHPEEIKATISAARRWYPEKKIIAIFQPHTYSRTKALFEDFAKSLASSDLTIITPIYASAREKKDMSVSSLKLAVYSQRYKNNVLYKKNKEDALEFLSSNLEDESIVITMGAGDIFLWHRDIIEVLKNKNKSHEKKL